MVEGLLLALCVKLGATTAVLSVREWRRHARRHPRLPIATIKASEFDPRFKFDSADNVCDLTVSFLSNHARTVPATPTDLESFLLAALAKGTKRLFEFGTGSGRTTYLLAMNSEPDARITTISMPRDRQMKLANQMNCAEVDHTLSESRWEGFVYTSTPAAQKIEQLFQDTATLDATPYRETMDLIFVDGGHSYPYVKNDSERALEMVAPGGTIVWHDYRGLFPRETRGVFQYLNELRCTIPLRRIEDTSLVVYRRPAA
jgi:predicted O-methyltransferase YrrM